MNRKLFIKEGFTLIEIMLVIVIISCLVAMVMPRLTGRLEQAKISTAKMDITVNIPTALKLYILDNGDFP
ncbi:MAG: prepilin-type N-terminal cleavage/methylation domain-containing protein, partial [Candidatus Omnitrophica bacterium]|nr:prepilin-type N-terminal cleavage/methylation domain-containing protein [Candidatus Omnitrophota bacterium]MBU1523244.1 prepilin-type N-terminal cleavage/methylation domain-containing protein [Candidatus Omnitrophota bacterium]